MKTILAYGDSNTWGCIPNGCDLKTMIFDRYDYGTRWTGKLQALLGSDYQIIEEGLNGRTTVFDDPLLMGRNGQRYLFPCLLSHHPIDLVILMLGTNDLKPHLGLQATDSAKGMRNLIKVIKSSASGPQGQAPEILMISPAPIIEGVGVFASSFVGAEQKSKALAKNYQLVSDLEECHFLNAGEYISSSPIDGVHLDEQAHQKLATVIAGKIKPIISEP